MTTDDLLRTAVEMGGSDLLIRVDSPPLVRCHGNLVVLDSPTLTPEEARQLSCVGLTQEQQDRFEADGDLSFSYAIPGVARFRGNLYRQRGMTQSVFRIIPNRVRSMEELRIPPVCKYFAERPRGLVLVSGPTGSGKSTTLAAMLDYINRHFALRVTTIEDPVEFVHEGKEAVISHREVGQDACFPQALHTALRQDNDVIVIGELNSPEMISLALTAAETGHLVLSTISTVDTIQTLDRIIDSFPSYQQNSARMRLSVGIIGIVSQRLVKNQDGLGRTASFETLVGVPSVRALIREGKTAQIHALIQGGSKQGMMTQDQSLANLVKKGVVTYEAALDQAHNLTEFDFLCSDVASAPDTGTGPAKPPTRPLIPS